MSNAQGIRAGAAYVELTLRDHRFTRALDAAAQKLKALGGSIMGIGAGLAGVGTAILAPLGALAIEFSDVGDAFDKMAGRTGLSVEALSELAYAADLSGTSIDSIEAAVRVLQRQVTAAAPSFQHLGLEITALQALAPEQQFLAVADALAQIEDPTQRAARAMQVFGKSGTQLLPLLADGAEGIEAMRAEARALGLVLSTDASQSAATLNDALGRLFASLRAIRLAIGSAIAPAFSELLDQALPVVALFGQWLRQNGQLILASAGLGATLVTVGAGVIGFGAVLWSLGTILSAVSAAIGGIGIALATLMSPITLVVAALAGLSAAWLTFTESGQASAQAIAQQLTDLADIARTTWAGIIAAIAKGDLQAALRIVTTGAELIWLQFIDRLTQLWVGFKNTVVDLWREAVTGWAMILNDFQAVMERNLGFWSDRSAAQINAERAAIERILIEDSLDTHEQASRYRQQQLRNAEQALQQARDELAQRLTEAQAPRPLPPARPGSSEALPSYAQVTTILQGARGSFTTPFANRQLGLDDRVAKQEALLEDLLGEVQDIQDILRSGLTFQ